jgi:hypothetical protein
MAHENLLRSTLQFEGAPAGPFFHFARCALGLSRFGTSAGDRAFDRAFPILIKKHAFSPLLATTHSCAVVLNSIGHLVEGAPAALIFLVGGLKWSETR